MWETAVIIAFLGGAALLIALAIALDKEHTAIKLLFLMVAMFIIVLTFSTNHEIINANNSTINNSNIIDSLDDKADTAYAAMLWTTWATLAYFMITILIAAINALGRIRM